MTKKVTTASTSSKKRSKFKKCPLAPKRFKSAYIFFSTEMMQTIKAQQKGSVDEKQKVRLFPNDEGIYFYVVDIIFVS